jgi:hypothetical protein
VKQSQSNAKTDDQLALNLYDTANWVISGQGQQILCFAASLRRAVERAETSLLPVLS